MSKGRSHRSMGINLGMSKEKSRSIGNKPTDQNEKNLYLDGSWAGTHELSSSNNFMQGTTLLN